jgi:ribosome modulation factor
MSHDDIAYDAGRQAYLDGQHDDVNPYQFGTQLYDDWEHGWDSAFQAEWRGLQMDAQDRVLDDPRRGQARDINRTAK